MAVDRWATPGLPQVFCFVFPRRDGPQKDEVRRAPHAGTNWAAIRLQVTTGRSVGMGGVCWRCPAACRRDCTARMLPGVGSAHLIILTCAGLQASPSVQGPASPGQASPDSAAGCCRAFVTATAPQAQRRTARRATLPPAAPRAAAPSWT
jgi:hypothetical protein